MLKTGVFYSKCGKRKIGLLLLSNVNTRGCFCLIWGLLNSDLIVVKCICLWLALYRITIISFGDELFSINHAILVQRYKMY